MHFQLHNHELLKKLVGTKSLNTLVENLAQYQSSPPFCWGNLLGEILKVRTTDTYLGGLLCFLSTRISYTMSLKKTLNWLVTITMTKLFTGYIFSPCKHVSVFFKNFELNTKLFPINWKKVCSDSKSDSHILGFFNWSKYYLTVLHLVLVLYMYLLKISSYKVW